MPDPVWCDPRYRRYFRGAVRLVERLATREGHGDYACLARLIARAAAGEQTAPDYDDQSCPGSPSHA